MDYPPRIASRPAGPRQLAHTYRPHGQALVEFTLIGGLFLLLLLGMVNIGQLLLANYTVSQAARAAAHMAAIEGGDLAAAERAAEQVFMGGLGTDSGTKTVIISCSTTPCRRYSPITVTVRYEQEFLARLPIFDTFRLEAKAIRAAERDAQ